MDTKTYHNQHVIAEKGYLFGGFGFFMFTFTPGSLPEMS
jgi:hypothetical protein